MRKGQKDIQLPSYNELLGIDDFVNHGADQIVEIPLSELHPFKDHPFQVRDDEKMEELTESIRERGVLLPILVRKYLAGRSRICSQGNSCTFSRFADFASCAYCRFTVCNGDVVLYCFVCYNNGFVFVHRNIQSIARYRCCSTVHRNGVDFIACIGGKGNRFG